MNRKGFTLVELLAVIVILALILVIGVPRVINTIEQSDKEAFRISAEHLVKEATDNVVKESIDISMGKTYTITDGTFVGDSIPMTGKLPDNGTINITSDGIVSIAVSDDKWCAIKYEDEENVFVSKDPDCQLFIPEVVPDTCFTRTNDGVQVTITDYNFSCSKNVIIPNTLDGLPVRIIGTNAFRLDNLLSVSIPTSVISIMDTAFYRNILTRINLSDNITKIGDFAFAFNSIREVDIPNNITIIEEGSFYKNQLTRVHIPSGVTTIEQEAFEGNVLPSIDIPFGVTSIGYYAFCGNQLTNLVLPASVTTISGEAFSSNLLTNISIPSSVTYIAESFNRNFLPPEQAFIYARNPDGSEDESKIVSYGGAKRDYVEIPEGVTTIGMYALQACSIESISIPNTVTTIETYGLMGNLLTNVIIPNSVSTLGNGTFSYNDLTSVIISDVLTEIPSMTFAYNKLTTIVIPNDISSIGSQAFDGNQLTSITIPANVTLSGYSPLPPTFYTSYVTVNARAAGTYTAPSQNGTWTKQP